MKINSKLKILALKAKSGQFVSFTYDKNGEKSSRVLRIGVDLEKAYAKNGVEFKNDSKNWQNHVQKSGTRNVFFEKDGEWFVKGIDMGDTSRRFPKIFKLNNISDIK